MLLRRHPVAMRLAVRQVAMKLSMVQVVVEPLVIVAQPSRAVSMPVAGMTGVPMPILDVPVFCRSVVGFFSLSGRSE